jgi:hypothetical protein
MNERTEIILGYEYDTIKEVADDVWHDEQPADAEDCNYEWEYKFKEILAQTIENRYTSDLNLDSLHPLISALVQLDTIDWMYIADRVFAEHVEPLIAEYEIECEKRRLDNMDEIERKEYYNELRGDEQYDRYVDDMLRGNL